MEFTDGIVMLRAIEPDDLPLLRQWINDPETARYLAPSWPVSTLDQRDWFERTRGASSTKKLAVELQDVGLVGMVSLMNADPLNRSVEVGITIGAAEQRGRGVASRALRLALDALFTRFGYNRVWAQILETNDASLKLFHRAGFTTEGTLRESAFWDGRMIGTMVLSILRSEFDALEARR